MITTQKTTLAENPITVKIHIKTDTIEIFDFETELELFACEDKEQEVSYFRFEKHFDTGKTYIHVASIDDYFVYENAEEFFEIEAIEKECYHQLIVGLFQDHTEAYLEFLEELEKEGEWS